jgi:hypothetical protein
VLAPISTTHGTHTHTHTHPPTHTHTQTLLAALQALGTPDSAVAALTTTVSALVGPGTGASHHDQPPPPHPPSSAAAADALTGLLAQCSLEASRRLAAAEAGGGGGGLAPMEEAGPATSRGAPVLAAGDGGETAVCPACGGQVAVARLAIHRERWCQGQGE